MGIAVRPWHTLKAVKTQDRPRQLCVVDTEASIRRLPDGGQVHTLGLGVGLYHRQGGRGKRRRDLWSDFSTAGEFWDWLISVSEQDRVLMFFGHNLSYDLRLLSAWHELGDRDFRCTGVYMSQGVFLATFKRGKFKIRMVDTMNWFRGSLQSWAETIGDTKVPVDFKRVSRRKLFEHCRKDVELTARLIFHWYDFVEKQGFGILGSTLPAQAFNTYRYRFMPVPIMIHGHRKALTLERDAYFGGRTECFRLGVFRGGPFTCFDVNSMYASVMRITPVPVRFETYSEYLSVKDLMKLPAGLGAVAEVVLETDEPVYPVAYDGRTLFPVGRFRTCLAWPELLHALAAGRVRSVIRAGVYRMAVIFSEYVRTLWRLRRKFQRADQKLWERLVKLMLNSLYGKFGTWGQEWKETENIEGESDGAYKGWSESLGREFEYFIIGGKRYELSGKHESFNSFPLISATITSAARLTLWRWIVKAGLSHVYYCDTDSLMTDSTGAKALAVSVDPGRLGKLKIEGVTRKLEIYSPKDYIFGRKRRIKGVRRDAKRIGPDTWSTYKFVGLRGAIRRGEMKGIVRVLPVVKRLDHTYHKGIVHSSGVVSPIALAEDC